MAKRIEKLRDLDTAELNERRARAGRADLPAALSAHDRAGRGGRPLRSARKDLARVKTLLARTRIEESRWRREIRSTRPARRAPRAPGTDRRGDQRQDAENHRRAVTRLVQHKLYRRVMRVSKKFYAHDEQGEARPGDTVRIVETRPMSKLKRWRLAEVVTRSTRAV